MNIQERHDMAAEAMKAAPPLTVSAATLAGVPVPDLVMWATLAYIVLQAGFLLYRWWRLATSASPVEVRDD